MNRIDYERTPGAAYHSKFLSVGQTGRSVKVMSTTQPAVPLTCLISRAESV